MNRTQNTPTGNPWAERENFPVIERPKKLLLALTVLLCSVGLAFSSSSIVVWVVLTLLAVDCVFLFGRTRMLPMLGVTLLVAFFASFQGTFSGGVFFAEVVLCVIVGTASLCWLLTVTQPAYIGILFPLAAFLLSWWLWQDYRIAICAFAFLPAAVTLSFATVGGKGRTSAILYAQGGLLLVVVTFFLLYFRQATGTMEISAWKELIEGWENDISESLIALRDAYVNDLQSLRADADTGALTSVLSDDAIRSLVIRGVNLLPGLIVAACGIFAFEAQALLCALYRRSGWGVCVTEDARNFTISPVTGIVYLICFVASLLSSPVTMFGAVVGNLSVILLPGLCVFGLSATVRKFRKAPSGGRVTLIFFFLLLMCCTGATVLGVFALVGAWEAIFGRIRERRQTPPDGEND